MYLHCYDRGNIQKMKVVDLTLMKKAVTQTKKQGIKCVLLHLFMIFSLQV